MPIGSLFKLADDFISIFGAPVEVTVDVTRMATKPIADVTNETVQSLKEGLDISND
jgi:hypothetical protein